jgi:hypothetical protein
MFCGFLHDLLLRLASSVPKIHEEIGGPSSIATQEQRDLGEDKDKVALEGRASVSRRAKGSGERTEPRTEQSKLLDSGDSLS